MTYAPSTRHEKHCRRCRAVDAFTQAAQAEAQTEMTEPVDIGRKRRGIVLPEAEHERAKQRAAELGITITDLAKRALTLERILFSNPSNIVMVKNASGEVMRILPL